MLAKVNMGDVVREFWPLPLGAPIGLVKLTERGEREKP
jgi:hypothetical protein